MTEPIFIPLLLTAIENDGFHLFAKVQINSQSTYVLIDTGASRSVFDESYIRQIQPESELVLHAQQSTGLGTDSMESRTTLLNHLVLGDLELPQFEVVVLDLSHVNRSYKKIGLPEIAGVIGGELLHKQRAMIDYGRRELILHP